MKKSHPSKQMEQMIQAELVERGIRDASVIHAFRQIPRHLFVEPSNDADPYGGQPLPIGHGQTTSEPYIIALILQALHLAPDDRVLEIGTGCGFQTALLSLLSQRVYTVERLEALLRSAQDRLKTLGFDNVLFSRGDGSEGWPAYAPFSKIVVSAASPAIPEPLRDQLDEGGILVIPVGESQDVQQLIRAEKIQKEGKTIWVETVLCPCRFVKLIGRRAWPAPSTP